VADKTQIDAGLNVNKLVIFVCFFTQKVFASLDIDIGQTGYS